MSISMYYPYTTYTCGFGFWTLRLITPWINPLWYPIDLNKSSGLSKREVSYPNPPMLCNDSLVEAEFTFNLNLPFQKPKSGKNTKTNTLTSRLNYSKIFPKQQQIKTSESIRYYLVGGFNPSEKYEVKLEIFPNFRGEHKKCLSCHHLAMYSTPCRHVFPVPDLMFHLFHSQGCRIFISNCLLKTSSAEESTWDIPENPLKRYPKWWRGK